MNEHTDWKPEDDDDEGGWTQNTEINFLITSSVSGLVSGIHEHYEMKGRCPCPQCEASFRFSAFMGLSNVLSNQLYGFVNAVVMVKDLDEGKPINEMGALLANTKGDRIVKQFMQGVNDLLKSQLTEFGIELGDFIDGTEEDDELEEGEEL